VRWSRPLAGTPKTVTVSREAHGYSVSFACADVPVQPLPATSQESGIDLGVASFATLADGTMIHHPRGSGKAERRRRKTAQRRVSRRTKGSTHRQKAVQLLARAPQTVPRHRRDCHHTVAHQLIQTHDTRSHADLQTANLVTNHHLATLISDAGGSQFLSILAATAAYAGRRVVAVPPANTSQTCSGCGVLVHQGLSVRWHTCPACGTSLHRDHTAARNIARRGQSLRGRVAVAASENRESAGLYPVRSANDSVGA
jgi:putative transposase